MGIKSGFSLILIKKKAKEIHMKQEKIKKIEELENKYYFDSELILRLIFSNEHIFWNNQNDTSKYTKGIIECDTIRFRKDKMEISCFPIHPLKSGNTEWILSVELKIKDYGKTWSYSKEELKKGKQQL